MHYRSLLHLFVAVASLSTVAFWGAVDTANARRINPEPPMATRPPPPPPPALLVKGPDGKVKPIELRKVIVDAKIVGHVAETSLTMTFYNPHSRVLEGDLYVPLPQGSTVSGYALDVGGQLVDGVVVTKDKARQVFEKEVRKGVDPGIVEWTKGNSFKTRVFPLPAKGARTIRLSYVSDVIVGSEGARYQLPLNFREAVGELALRLEVVQSPAAPVVTSGGPKGLKFAAARNSYVAEASVKNSKLTDDLIIQLPPVAKAPVRVQTDAKGDHYFSIFHTGIELPKLPVLDPQRLGITWDASLSRDGRDLSGELTLLRQYLSRLDGSVVVELSVLRNSLEMVGTWRVSGGQGVGDVINAIKALNYDGGTQLGVLGTERRAGKRDLNLLFSDGISNFGVQMPDTMGAPTWVINSATTANHALLRHIATQSGGAYLNLNTLDSSTALASIGRAVYQFLGAKVDGGGTKDIYPKLRQPVFGSFGVGGVLTGSNASITLQYGVGDKVMASKTFKVVRDQATAGEMMRRYWAQKHIDDLLVFTDDNADALVRVGKRHGIVTPGTSLIVLETLAQYVEHRIRPPKMLAKMRADYDNRVEALDSAEKRAETSKLDRIVKLWEARKAWWKTEFKYPKNFRFGGNKKVRRQARPATTGSARPQADDMAGAPAPAEVAEGEPGAATDKKAKGKSGGKQRPEPGVAMKPWNPDTPYLRAIKAAPKAKRYAEYLKQRREHGSAPAFFLDCAHYFRKQGDTTLALRILSNIAELELENAALVRVLAHRLSQVDELDLAIGLFRTAKQMRPEEPQSFRDLGLVLARRAAQTKTKRARRADYAEALALLGAVVMERWDRFAEIEVIALTELNNIWPKAKAAGVKDHGLDGRLIAQLDMDIRIVMSWDADMTDMDLHVVEPSGEEAYYSHNRTRIGGMVTRDFTRGYGPEVYAVRRAMKGSYKVKTKYYGSSAAKLSGGVTLQVDVFTNFGRSNEKRRSVTLRLTEKKETFTVAEIEF